MGSRLQVRGPGDGGELGVRVLRGLGVPDDAAQVQAKQGRSDSEDRGRNYRAATTDATTLAGTVDVEHERSDDRGAEPERDGHG